tara:strand:+ start:885 stop:1061 length:177 start_codon:yes stop_codon:yes gene_type:complete
MSYFGVPIRNGVAIGLGAITSLKSGGSAAAAPATSAIIQEASAFYILLEDGVSKILLE